MNRPLAAFGALMTFLVLAMLSVSSTSRSTSVQAVRPVKRMAATQHRRGLAKEIQVASISKTAGATEECEAVCGRVMAESYLTSLTVSGKQQVELATVRIVATTDAIGAVRIPDPMGCLSHCDSEYDRIVYGERKEGKNLRTEEPKRGEPEEIADEEMTAIFYGLVDGTSGKSGVTKNVVGTAHPTGIDWEEYAGLIDQAISGAAVAVERWGKLAACPTAPVAAAETVKTCGSGGSVRSGDWLRHSAALSLYRVGALLQAAALEVEHASGNFADQSEEGFAR